MNLDKFADNWLGKTVSFKLMGKTVTGKVREVLDTVCASGWIVAEFRDNGKQVKVGGPYQAFKRIS